MPIILRYLLGAVIGYAGFRLMEYLLSQIDEEEAKPIVDAEVAKRGLNVTGVLLKANQPNRDGLVFSPEELKKMASKSVYLEYDENLEALRYTGLPKK